MTEGRSPVCRVAEGVRPGAEIQRVDPLNAGSRRRTAAVHFADADAVVIQLDDDPAAVRVEARLRDAIDERTAVPVPAPLGSGTVRGHGWLATRLVSATDLHQSFTGLDPRNRRRIARSFGRYLAELHEAFRFDAHGPLSVVDGELAVDGSRNSATAMTGGLDAETICDGSDGDGTTAGWRSWLAAFGRGSLARLPSEFDAIRADVADALVDPDIASTPVPRLFPWDFRPGNALIADGRIAAVLDWEGPLAAAPALSVAKAEYLVADWYVGSDEADSLREAFRAGYESVRKYPCVRAVHRIAAVVSTAVDSRGAVTNPGYPPVSRAEAVQFHRRALRSLL